MAKSKSASRKAKASRRPALKVARKKATAKRAKSVKPARGKVVSKAKVLSKASKAKKVVSKAKKVVSKAKVVAKAKTAMTKRPSKPQQAQVRSSPKPAPMAQASSNGKRTKNQAGLTAREVESFRDLLLAKRRELLGDVTSMETEALQNGGGVGNLSNLPDHMADQGTDNYEQEFTLGLMEKDRKLLREIDAALQKIQDGTYGICEGTGKTISKARLEAQPWARYSIEYARKMEAGGGWR